MPTSEPVPAATVILIRDGARSPEVLLIERHARSEFLPDMYVFPGGRVEKNDAELARHMTGIGGARASELLNGIDPELALAFFAAAIRETFEESGILLARRRGEEALVGPDVAEALAPHRLAVQGGDESFAELIRAAELELAADCLAVHAHWITPVMVPRRFDTIFFSAFAPPGQLAAHDGIESTDHVWIRPEDALSQAAAGERQIIFPTLCNLETLSGFSEAHAALRASVERPVVPVLPELLEREGRRVLVIPPEAGYARTEQDAAIP